MHSKIMRKMMISMAALVASFGTANAQSSGCNVELNYENSDIRLVIDAVALHTGRTFLLDPAVSGNVTIKSPQDSRLCPDEVWELFQALLRVNGYAATPIGADKFKIVRLQQAARSGGVVAEAGANGEGIVTQIVRLNYIDAREAASNLAQLIGENSVVTPVRGGNALILVDTASNIERLRSVLEQLDQDTTIYRTIALQHASASDVAGVIRGLAEEISEDSGSGGNFSILAMDASNSLLIRAEPSLVRRLQTVVAELDRFGETTSDLAVIRLKHTDAEELAPLLSELANNVGPAGGGNTAGARQGPRATVTFHKPTNSILINGGPDIQRTLQRVVSQLDVRRAQVLVEAIIVEVSDTTARDLGLQYFLTGTDGSSVPFSSTNFQRTNPNLLAAAGTLLLEGQNDTLSSGVSALQEQALSSLLSVDGLALGGAGTIGESVFGALLTAIDNDTTSNVLSTPSVMTLDNQTARLQVGQEIPITTGEAIGDNLTNAFRTVDREEVGVILEVTPQINDGQTVTLEIIQEISSVAGPVIAESSDLITNKREISTTALVDNGDILVIGGLIDEARAQQEAKVPVLGDVPGLGTLFKSTSNEKRRQNLMVFIRPTIVRDQETARSATNKKLDYIRARELLQTGQPHSEMDRLINRVTGLHLVPDEQSEE